MKERIGKQIFVIFFFVICIVPVIGMIFTQENLSENRTLSSFPEWKTQEGTWNQGYFTELTTYIAEHFWLRSQLVELDSTLKYDLCKTPSDTQVILGKGDWLFFDATLPDYAGVTMTQEDIAKLADQLQQICTYITELGKEPMIMLVPNKNSIYEEYMPPRFGSKAQVTNLSLLQEAMEKVQVPYVDAAAVLQEGKMKEEVYLHQDTHWNNTGARMVLNELYQSWKIEEGYSLEDYTIENSHESDLRQILFPTQDNLEPQRIYPQKKEFSYVGRVRSMDDLNIQTQQEQGNGKSVLVFRDSFGRALIPYMAEVFDTCTFVRSTPYNLEEIANTECDYVLIEIIERNIGDLCGIQLPQ